MNTPNDAGKNLKVGGHRKFFGRSPPLFGSKSTISRFGDGQYTLVSFLFAVLLFMVPHRAQPFVKVGETCPPGPIPYGVVATEYTVSTMISGHLSVTLNPMRRLS